MSASVNLPLHHKVQNVSSGTGSLGWFRKKGRKTVVVWWFPMDVMHFLLHMMRFHVVCYCVLLPNSDGCTVDLLDSGSNE